MEKSNKNCVGIIIPFYGGNQYLIKLIDSIFNNESEFGFLIIIVDNSRAGEKVDKSYTSVYEGIVVLDAGEGIGYGAACNIGFTYLKNREFEYAVVINQDGYLEKNAISLLINEIKTNNECAATMPLSVGYDNNIVEPFFISVYLTKLNLLISDLFGSEVKKSYEIEDLCGACFAIRISTISKFNFVFDKLFHMYYEDQDLYKRLKSNGHSVFFIPKAVFHHNHSHTDRNLQTLRMLIGKRTSHHVFSLLHSPAGFTRAFIGWLILSLRNFVMHLLTFNLNELIVEFMSFIKCIMLSPDIIERRKGHLKKL